MLGLLTRVTAATLVVVVAWMVATREPSRRADDLAAQGAAPQGLALESQRDSPPPAAPETPAPLSSAHARLMAPPIRWSVQNPDDLLADGPRLVAGAPRDEPPDAAGSRRAVLLRAAFAADRAWEDRPPGAPPGVVDPALFGDPLLRAAALWRRLSRADRPDWAEVAALYGAFPDWPLSSAAQRRVEEAISEGVDRASLLDFFERRPPLTARGARLYGEALITAGQRAAGEALIREAYVERAMSSSEKTLYALRHAPLVDPLRLARHDRLLVRQRIDAARWAAAGLSKGRRLLTEAVAALAARRGNVDAKIAAVPEDLRAHPALRYARMKWRYKKRRYADAESEMLSASAAYALGDPAVWADERRYLSREAFEEGRPMTAYIIAAGNGLSAGTDFAELEWFAGWMALTFLEDPSRAKPHFEKLYHGVRSPISRARAAFWAGEATDEIGERAFWYRLAAQHPQTFYGQMALARLGAPAALTEAAVAPTPTAVAAAGQSAMAQVAGMLYAAGRPGEARAFLEAEAERLLAARPPADLAALAGFARRFGDPWGLIRIAKAAEMRGIHLWGALYPAPERPIFSGRRVDPALLLAVARQESRFNVSASSSAGALGLMQLMPGTARMNARSLGLPYSKARLTAHPSYNLTLGDAHMARELKQFRGATLLAVAAYNAGGGNVAKWLRRFGDPRDPGVDPIRWIESIPFSETRNYVQRVLEGAQVYGLRLRDGAGPITLHADLAMPAGQDALLDPSLADPSMAARVGIDLDALRAPEPDGGGAGVVK